MIKFLGTSAFLALALAASPASAQLLGGSGGLGGTLGGALGGGMGSMGGSGMGNLGGMIDGSMRGLPRAGDTMRGTLDGATRTERSVDTRKGHVKASNESALDTAVANSSRIGDRTGGGALSGSASGSGSAEAQLIGTDTVRGAARDTLGRTRDAAGGLRDTARNAAGEARTTAGNTVGRARDALPSPATVTGTASAAANGAVSRGRMLAAEGSASARQAGAFLVSAGMPVTDARGKTIGTVQSVRSNASGTVEQVLVQTRNGTATLPAANFTGSGSALVSAMGKGEVKKAAE